MYLATSDYIIRYTHASFMPTFTHSMRPSVEYHSRFDRIDCVTEGKVA